VRLSFDGQEVPMGDDINRRDFLLKTAEAAGAAGTAGTAGGVGGREGAGRAAGAPARSAPPPTASAPCVRDAARTAPTPGAAARYRQRAAGARTGERRSQGAASNLLLSADGADPAVLERQQAWANGNLPRPSESKRTKPSSRRRGLPLPRRHGHDQRPVAG